MSAVVWSVVLVALGCGGLYFAPRHWWGWLITTGSELLWLTYALTIGAVPLAVMSVVWFVFHARGAVVSYRDSHPKRRWTGPPTCGGGWHYKGADHTVEDCPQ